jgi:hypothetical protein
MRDCQNLLASKKCLSYPKAGDSGALPIRSHPCNRTTARRITIRRVKARTRRNSRTFIGLPLFKKSQHDPKTKEDLPPRHT